LYNGYLFNTFSTNELTVDLTAALGILSAPIEPDSVND
jgi:hypothetical protein